MSIVPRAIASAAALTLTAGLAGVVAAPPASADICLPLPIPGLPCLPELPVPLPGLTGPEVVTPVAVDGKPSEAKVGETLRANPPVWNPENAATEIAWLRDGTEIEGATELVYTLGADDLGHAVSVRARGSSNGLASTDSVSDEVEVERGDAPTNTEAPRISGQPRLDGTLMVRPGTWSGSPEPTFTYQWYRSSDRGATAIEGATETGYRVTQADVGRGLAVLVTATRPGFETGDAVSNLVAVDKFSTRTNLSLVTRTVKAGQAARVRVALSDSTGDAPTGRIRIVEGTKTLKTVALDGPGPYVVRLPVLAPGFHRLQAVYLGDATRARSTSLAVPLEVKKARKSTRS